LTRNKEHLRKKQSNYREKNKGMRAALQENINTWIQYLLLKLKGSIKIFFLNQHELNNSLILSRTAKKVSKQKIPSFCP
jgi:hypothetical protein